MRDFFNWYCDLGWGPTLINTVVLCVLVAVPQVAYYMGRKRGMEDVAAIIRRK